MIDIINKVTNQKALDNAVKRFKERGVILPTFKQQQNPDLIPQKIKDQLKNIGLWVDSFVWAIGKWPLQNVIKL